MEPEIYEKTAKNLSTDPEQGKKLAELAARVETEERIACKPEGYEVLPREKVLECIESVEIQKARAQAGIVIAS